MSSGCTLPRPEPSRDGPPGRSGPEAAATAVEFHYTQTDSFAPLLRQLRVSLLVTTYQANKLLVVRETRGGLSTALAGEELSVVNSRFSCLCTLHLDYSFVPRWRPPFCSRSHDRGGPDPGFYLAAAPLGGYPR